MGAISQNQMTYLQNLASQGGGNGEWAKSQLAGAYVAPSTPVPPPSTPAPSSSSSGSTYKPNVGIPAATPSPSSSSGSTGYSSPSYSYTSPAPSYSTPSTPSYTAPATQAPASSYSGTAQQIGSTSNAIGSKDGLTDYQAMYDKLRAQTGQNQVNTWQDKSGNVYNTTNMTAQQIYALSLAKDGNPNAAAILSGMGLDMNGNPKSSGGGSSVPAPSGSSAPTGAAANNGGGQYQITVPSGGGGGGGSTGGGGAATSVPAPQRYNVDAPATDRLAYFKSNVGSAQAEILAVKDMYMKEMAAGASAERLSQISAWADEVRKVANINPQDVMYGNGPVTMGQGLGGGAGTGTGTSVGGGVGGGMGGMGGAPLNQFPVRNMSDISKYVDGQIAKKLSDAAAAKSQAEREALANADKTRGSIGSTLTNAVNRLTSAAGLAQQGIQTGYERDRELTADNRTLEDFRAQNVLNPFSGKSDYAYGLMARERAITDRQASEDLQGRIGGINTDLNNNLSQAQLDAQNKLNGIDSDLSVLQQKLTENYNQLQNTSGAERERLLMEISNNERDYQIALRGQDREDILANATLARDKFNQDLQTFNANRGVYESDRTYDLEGKKYDNEFDYNNKQFDLDKWYKEQSIGVAQQNANNAGKGSSGDSAAMMNAQLAREQWEYKLSHPEAAKSQLDMHINNLAKVWMQKQEDGNYAVTNEKGLRDAIMDLHLPTQDTMQALATFGLSLYAPKLQSGAVEMN